MNLSPFSYTSTWFKQSIYEIANNTIVKSNNAIPEKYNPFDYYNNPVIISEKKPKKKSIDEMPIHIAFASINTQDDSSILEWVNKYGLPYSYAEYKGNVVATFPVPVRDIPDDTGDVYDKMPTSKFIESVKNFKLLIELYDATTSSPPNYDSINTLSKSDQFFNLSAYVDRSDFVSTQAEIDYFSDKYESNIDKAIYNASLLSNTPVKMTLFDIKNILNSYLYGSRLVIDFEQTNNKINGKWQWEYGSLLSAMYRMLFLDWTQGFKILQCKNENCHHFFVPKRASRLYCSEVCRNATQQREYRKRASEK